MTNTTTARINPMSSEQKLKENRSRILVNPLALCDPGEIHVEHHVIANIIRKVTSAPKPKSKSIKKTDDSALFLQMDSVKITKTCPRKKKLKKTMYLKNEKNHINLSEHLSTNLDDQARENHEISKVVIENPPIAEKLNVLRIDSLNNLIPQNGSKSTHFLAVDLQTEIEAMSNFRLAHLEKRLKLFKSKNQLNIKEFKLILKELGKSLSNEKSDGAIRSLLLKDEKLVAESKPFKLTSLCLSSLKV